MNEFETDTAKLLIHSVNVLLQLIGEAPIETEEDISNVLEAQIAYDVLIETKKEILADEWDVNYDENYSFPVDSNGYIPIPYNVLEINSTDGDLIIRNWMLYSKSNQSTRFDESQTVNVVWDVLFNSLSHAIRNYITVSAGRKFQARQIMDTSVYAYTVDDEEKAMYIAKRSDGRTIKPNMYDEQYGQNYLVSGTL